MERPKRGSVCINDGFCIINDGFCIKNDGFCDAKFHPAAFLLDKVSCFYMNEAILRQKHEDSDDDGI